ncbi:DUF7094 domain-containing protein [Halostella litorea]|uniref:DUF7094 domain-containing protein n=1 Tax=Halostella litorea TaxID=2528831 RepID=UPI0010931562|nr:hypothetical protein [Halostella litorea]
MKRITALAMVLLLAVPAPVLAAPAGGSLQTTAADRIADDADESNTTSRLTLSGDVTSRVGSQSPDMAQVVGDASTDVENRVRTQAANLSIRTASSATARAAAAEELLDDIEARTDRLHRTERAAVRAYANGSSSATELLRTLASVHASAESLDEALYAHARLSASIEGYEADDRRGAVRTQLDLLRSPARAQLGEAFAGSGDAESVVQVAASESGVVVGTLAGDQYHREAIRYDNRNDNTTDTYDGDLAAVLDHVRTDLYPWAAANQQGDLGLSGVYDGRHRLTIPHDQGTLTIYIDGNTRSVFREFQALDVDELPRETAVDDTEGDLRVRIERTPGDGPIRFNATDAAGDPVDATVRINGDRVGTTGDDGYLWTLPPRSYYLTTVSADGATVNATVGI